MFAWIIAISITVYVVIGLALALSQLYLNPPSEHDLKHDTGTVAATVLVLLFLWPAVLLIFGISRLVCSIAARGRARKERRQEVAAAAVAARSGAIQGGFSED